MDPRDPGSHGRRQRRHPPGAESSLCRHARRSGASAPNVSRSRNTPRRSPSDRRSPARRNVPRRSAGSMPKALQQPGGDDAVGPRAVDLQGAAVQQVQAAVQTKLIALGMAAEIVVVIQDQNARPGPRVAVKHGRRQPADAAANNDQIVLSVAGVVGGQCQRPVAQRMRRLERARDDRRAIRSGQGGRDLRPRPPAPAGNSAAPARPGHSIQHIAPRDRLAHAETNVWSSAMRPAVAGPGAAGDLPSRRPYRARRGTAPARSSCGHRPPAPGPADRPRSSRRSPAPG